MNDHSHFQFEVVTRMLEVTRSQSIEFGLTRWELLAPLKPAYEATRAEFQDETLMWSKRMQLREQILQENQPIMIENEAYIVKRCLCGTHTQDSGLKSYLWLTKTTLHGEVNGRMKTSRPSAANPKQNIRSCHLCGGNLKRQHTHSSHDDQLVPARDTITN